MQVGHQLVEAYSSCMGVPLFRRRITGTSATTEMGYKPTDGDEVEDLHVLLAAVKDAVPQLAAVCSGAIASDYQRVRVESVAARLNLVSLAYLWHQPQHALLRGMVACGIEAILCKVRCAPSRPGRACGVFAGHMSRGSHSGPAVRHKAGIHAPTRMCVHAQCC